MVAGWTDGILGGATMGGFDSFLARYDGEGNSLWIRQFGSSGTDSATALAPDGAGGVMVVGYSFVSRSIEAFLARYDSAGNRLWIRQFGTSLLDTAWTVAPDGEGGALVAGYTKGSLASPNLGGNDVFLARYDSEGNQLWIRQFGTTSPDEALALAPDGAGGVMVAGYTGGDLGGPNAGVRDAFLARYDGAGNQLWIRQFGTPESDEAFALAPDGAGGVMVGGHTRGSLVGTSAGWYDAFLARYDSVGNQLWIRQFGTGGADNARALTPDGAGGVMVTGNTAGDLGAPIPDPGPFLARYDGAGNRLWIQQFGGSEGGASLALATDGAGDIMVAGHTGGSLGGPSAGSWDVFLARYSIGSCYADCDKSTGNGVLDIFDFLCFQDSFVNSEPYACDCDTTTGQGVCDIFDFLCFQNAFVNGCP